MCVLLLQIQEVFMFYFCELYHEILIVRNGGGRGIRTPEDVAALTDFKSQMLE